MMVVYLLDEVRPFEQIPLLININNLNVTDIIIASLKLI